MRGEEDGAAYALGPEQLCVVVLDELVWGDREAAYGRLLEFLGVDDDAAMREFFDDRDEPGRSAPRRAGARAWAPVARPPGAATLRARPWRSSSARATTPPALCLDAYERGLMA